MYILNLASSRLGGTSIIDHVIAKNPLRAVSYLRSESTNYFD